MLCTHVLTVHYVHMFLVFCVTGGHISWGMLFNEDCFIHHMLKKTQASVSVHAIFNTQAVLVKLLFQTLKNIFGIHFCSQYFFQYYSMSFQNFKSVPAHKQWQFHSSSTLLEYKDRIHTFFKYIF